MKTLQKLAKEQKGRYYSLFAIAIAFGFVMITQAYLIVSIVDDLFLNQVTFDQVTAFLLLLLAVFLFRSLLSYWSGKIGLKMAAQVKADYRKRLLQAYSRHSLMSSYKGQSGQKVSVMMDAVDELDNFFSKYVPQRIITTVVPVMILVVVFTQHVYSGLILLFTAPFIPIFMIIIGKMTQEKSEEKLDSLTAFSGRFLDTLQGLMSLKLYGRSKHYKEVIRQSSLEFRDATMKILKVAFTSSLMLEFISMLSIGLVALELGFRLVVFNEISFFTAFFILLLVPEFYNLLKELGSAFHAGRSSTGASDKIERELSQAEQTQTWGSRSLSKGPVSLELRNVSFQYETNGFTLSDINANLPKNGQTAIVGKSGSGKTTLLHIVAGLIQPQEGKVLTDGHERLEYKEEDWFSKISYITQHPYLFAGTIAENIALGTKATKADIEEAAVKAGISDLIETLPERYDTPIGEGGRGLSGGEKQRIALARAFLKKPSIVLFDEPTTGLDLFTEQILQKSIKELAQTSTVITVAHRLQTIKEANHILFLENGELKSQGTHEQLKASVSSYKRLFSKNGEEE
ncbi:thiol reductant ABC exporter subunit CydD [Alkalihalobacterium chitinilyticum]|uniref:Thiol reductant ABC exporter subunit CydD n=1 Tax=Alkalihalobacterium chitinilyticum TaxID=2980103 RepID=A0ABT5VH80_9BACI|nr:thiol reductant ABC exporter subunit CydD [Alkalihalobacterium chitinilyticum]MDE5414801.1 thiol reductant ABC exporter subunit CydD [Alkalihalobacterium chitinilyticum]